MTGGRNKTQELLVSLCSAALIAGAGAYLYLDFFSKGEGQGRVVGRVGFELGGNARRPAGRVTWGRIERGDPLFRNDTVRTADSSEALLDLEDGTVVEMDPLSMIVLNVRDDENEIEVRSGSVLIRTGPASRWRVAGRPEPLGPRRILRFSREADGDLIERSYGNVAGQNDADRGGAGPGDSSAPRALAPPENSHFFTETPGEDGTQRIRFRWQSAGAANSQQKTRLVVARDPSFAREVAALEVAGDSAATTLGPGRYYWRVRDARGRTSPVARFSVVELQVPRLIAPADGTRLAGAGESAPVVFLWRGPAGASYRLEVARDVAFQTAVFKQQVHRTGITLALPSGSYYWRLTALGYFPESRALSPTRSFTVVAARDSAVEGAPDDAANEPGADEAAEAAAKKIDEPGAQGTEAPEDRPAQVKPPLPIFPEYLMPLDMAARESIPFRWTAVPGARSYLFRLYNVEKNNLPVFVLRTTGPYLLFTRLDLLDEGEFLWTVDAELDADRRVRGYGRFHILLSERPDQPELQR